MTTNTGGPAFPLTMNGTAYDGKHLPQDGMTLRDYFAAKVLPTLIVDGDALEAVKKIAAQAKISGFDATAQVAYMYADAMLKVRAS